MTSKLKQLKNEQSLILHQQDQVRVHMQTITKALRVQGAPTELLLNNLDKYLKTLATFTTRLKGIDAEIAFEETRMRPIGVVRGRSNY